MKAAHRLPTDFGRLVRGLRVANALTQAELAEAAAISERTVSDLERGLRAAVYPATARRLASALAVSELELARFLELASGSQRGRPDGSPLGAAATPRPRRVPVPLTALLGREAELMQVIEQLRDRECRLVTLVGPGGVGKTRLALEIAQRQQISACVSFVSLSDVQQPRQLLPAIATAAGLEPGSGDVVAQLALEFGQGPVLVVLDTFEHVVAGAPDLLDVLSACPELKFLVTSRTPLRLRGERELLLQPLPVRAVARAEEQPAAVRLFLERSHRGMPAAPADESTLETVSAICERLDGLPLAIELAAARTRHLSPANLLAQLHHRLEPLVGGARDLPARHQTMRAALDWSYDLLEEPESRLFRALSVFRGGFGLDAVAEVGAVDLGTAVALVSGLVDASLVQLEPDCADLPRYRLLDVIREYAAERAQMAAELEALSERHARHFLALAEVLGPALRGEGQERAQERLLLEEGNLREALTWALGGGSSQVALRLAGALWMFWRRAGLFAEGRRWLEAALAAGEECPPEIRLQGLWGAGWLAFQQGDYARTGAAGRSMLQLVEQTRVPPADGGSIQRRNGLTLLGMAAVGEDRGGDALEALGEALELCRGMGTSWHRATSLLNYGGALMHAGQCAEGAALLEEALALYGDLGDREFVARTSIQLGYAALLGGDRNAAEARIRRGMELFAAIGDSWGIAEGLEAVATLLAAAGDSDEGGDALSAAVLVGASERLRERISARPHPADARLSATQLDEARRRLSGARWDEARREGYSMALEDVLHIAIK